MKFQKAKLAILVIWPVANRICKGQAMTSPMLSCKIEKYLLSSHRSL